MLGGIGVGASVGACVVVVIVTVVVGKVLLVCTELLLAVVAFWDNATGRKHRNINMTGSVSAPEAAMLFTVCGFSQK